MHEDQGSQIHKRNNESFSLKLIESVVSKIEEQTETSRKWLTVAIFLKWQSWMIMDYHRLSTMIMDYHVLAWTGMDWH